MTSQLLFKIYSDLFVYIHIFYKKKKSQDYQKIIALALVMISTYHLIPVLLIAILGGIGITVNGFDQNKINLYWNTLTSKYPKIILFMILVIAGCIIYKKSSKNSEIQFLSKLRRNRVKYF